MATIALLMPLLLALVLALTLAAARRLARPAPERRVAVVAAAPAVSVGAASAR